MQKKYTLIAFLTFIYSNAQIHDKNDIEISGIFGVASSNYYGNSSLKDNQSIFNLSYGINFDFYGDDRWSFRTGFEFKTFGSKFRNYNYSNIKVYDTEEKYQYIFVPLFANWHFGSQRNWNLNFGPTLSFLQSGTHDGVKVTTKGLRKKQIGFGIGIGYKFELSNNFSIAIEHQEYFSITSNTYMQFFNSPFIGNYSGSFDVRLVYTLKSKYDNDDDDDAKFRILN